VVRAVALQTRLTGRASGALPDDIKAKMHRQMAEPGSGKQQGEDGFC